MSKTTSNTSGTVQECVTSSEHVLRRERWRWRTARAVARGGGERARGAVRVLDERDRLVLCADVEELGGYAGRDGVRGVEDGV